MENLEQKARASKLRDAYQSVFEKSDGKIVLNDLIKLSKFFEDTTVEGDPHMTYYNNGRRNIVANILKRVFGRQDDILKYKRQTSTLD